MSAVIENVQTPLGINIIKDYLSNRKGLNIKCIQLKCNRTINHKRDHQRIEDHQVKEGVDTAIDELHSYDQNGDIIENDSSNLTVTDVISSIKES